MSARQNFEGPWVSKSDQSLKRRRLCPIRAAPRAFIVGPGLGRSDDERGYEVAGINECPVATVTS